MRQKFTITESERLRIKGLYEQPETQQEKPTEPQGDTNNQFFTDGDIGINVNEIMIHVKLKNHSDSDFTVILGETDADETLEIKEIIDNSGEDIINEDEVRNYVNGLLESGYFDLRPLFISYDLNTGRLDADIPTRG